MKTLVVLFAVIAAASAFDCFGRNNTCTGSRMKCDTGYEPFCEHMECPGPGRFLGFCSCDKECTSAADCSNPAAEGCPPQSHAMCDMKHHICHCGRPRDGNRT